MVIARVVTFPRRGLWKFDACLFGHRIRLLVGLGHSGMRRYIAVENRAFLVRMVRGLAVAVAVAVAIGAHFAGKIASPATRGERPCCRGNKLESLGAQLPAPPRTLKYICAPFDFMSTDFPQAVS